MNRWKPKDLYLTQLRGAIHRISSGCENLEQATSSAVAALIEQAKLPGIDTPKPFETCHSLASILKTSLARVHACGIPSGEGVRVIPTGGYGRGLYDGAAMHLWVTQHDSTPEAWATMDGYTLPVKIHVIDIGNLDYKTGRFNSDWCRCFTSKKYAGLWTFRPKSRHCWKTIYFEDGKNDPQVWIRLMDREGVTPFKTYSAMAR